MRGVAMMRHAAGAVLIAVLLAAPAHALTSVEVDACLAGQLRIVGKGAAATLACYAKAAAKGVPASADCLTTAGAKLGPKLDDLEARKVCIVEGSGSTRTTNASSFGTLVDGAVGHAAGKCDAAKTGAVAKYVAALTGCFAKAAAKTGMVDVTCVSKATAKLDAAIAKAEAKSDCTNTAQTAFLLNAAGSYAESETCALEPGAPGCAQCGNGLNDPFEPCDASAPSSGWTQCGPDVTCTACNCACPTTIQFTPDAAASETTLDAGWTGVDHGTPVVGSGMITFHLGSCTGPNRPCGDCAVDGLVANTGAGAGELDNRRCSTNSAKKCTSDAPCAARSCLGGANDGASCALDSECPSGGCPPAGVCAFYVGPALPVAAGGVASCVVSQLAAPVDGTVNVESGEMHLAMQLSSRLYAGVLIDDPCPRCTDAGLNDGANDGTCDAGPRAGLACDANGTVPTRPDFGATSLDCPPLPGALLANLAIVLDTATDSVAKTLTTGSPNCSGSPGDKCLCDTCNDAAAEPCADNGDCPDPLGPIGPICGGKRCLGGPNVGSACTTTSECPGNGLCAHLGEPTKPSTCIDDTSADNRVLDCADADGDGRGECTLGPLDETCTVASGHAQRSCFTDADCGNTAGSCASHHRSCFPTGGGTFQPSGRNDGTDTLVVIGMEDTPVASVSHPTLGGIFCIPPTESSARNNVTGLPGPARLLLKGQAVARP